MARPSDYSPEIVTSICERMAEGEGLRKICADKDLPDRVTFLRWVAKHPELRHMYASARDALTDYWAEEIHTIAFDDRGDLIRHEDGTTRVDHENIQRSRLKVDTLKWLMSKLSPRKYGEKLAVTGDEGGPVETITRIERIIHEVVDPADRPPLSGDIPGRVIDLIRRRVPADKGRAPDELFAEVLEVLDQALIARYGAKAVDESYN